MRRGSIIPIALPGSIIVARIAATQKAALDPKPPLLIRKNSHESGNQYKFKVKVHVLRFI